MEGTDFRGTLWLTGLPCSGKTTLAKELQARLAAEGIVSVLLDADELRRTVNADLGFSPEDRKENLRRAAHICRLLNANGRMVIACFVSPLEEYRAMVRDIVGDLRLVYVKCGRAECEKRDVKGMYKKARAGSIADFTGVSAPFEEPARPDMTVDTEREPVAECARSIMEGIKVRNGR